MMQKQRDLEEYRNRCGKSNSEHMMLENGTQVSSKTTWQRGKTERIDAENSSPGKRPGQIHYHDANNNKFYLTLLIIHFIIKRQVN